MDWTLVARSALIWRMVFLSAFSFFCVCRDSPFGIICGGREKRIKPHSTRENPVVTETGVPPLLELNRVTVIRGDENKRVLDRISFKVLPGEHVAILGGNLPDRTELHKPDQSDKIDQQVGSLRLGNGSQKISETRRNFSGNNCSHGFRALLGLVSKGDFGRKPFFLNQLSLLIT